MTHQEWPTECLAPGEAHRHQIVRCIYSGRTQFQQVEVVQTKGYGVGLFLGGRIQHVEGDEYVYSEVMAHPAAILLGGSARRALVVGGGPGGEVRELLRHRSIAEVVQVEIDPEMIRVGRTYFAHIAQGCEDPRVRLVIDDVREFLRQSDERFDLIAFDVSEPIAGTPAQETFGKAMVERLAGHLSPAGIFTTWAGEAGPRSSDLARGIYRNVCAPFPHAASLLCHMPSYGTPWLTLLASHVPLAPLDWSADAVDDCIRQQVAGDLRFYDGTTHVHLFHLPRDLRLLLARAPHEPDNDDGPRLDLDLDTLTQSEGETP